MAVVGIYIKVPLAMHDIARVLVGPDQNVVDELKVAVEKYLSKVIPEV